MSEQLAVHLCDTVKLHSQDTDADTTGNHVLLSFELLEGARNDLVRGAARETLDFYFNIH